MLWRKKHKTITINPEPQVLKTEVAEVNKLKCSECGSEDGTHKQGYTCCPAPIIFEDENDKADFITTDDKLAFSLQDKFVVKAVYFDKNNNGFKTFVFNATKKEVETYLKEVKC